MPFTEGIWRNRKVLDDFHGSWNVVRRQKPRERVRENFMGKYFHKNFPISAIPTFSFFRATLNSNFSGHFIPIPDEIF